MWMNLTTEEFYRDLVGASSLEVQLQEKLFGVGGEYEPTDAEVLAYATDTMGYYGAKHILLMTVNPNEYVYDDAGNPIGYAPLSEDEIAGKKADAEAMLKKLREAKDPIALFDDLMFEHRRELAEKDKTIAYYRKIAEKATDRKQRAIRDSERRAKLNFSYAALILVGMAVIPWFCWFVDTALKNFWIWAN
jgi:hypothetical protein